MFKQTSSDSSDANQMAPSLSFDKFSYFQVFHSFLESFIIVSTVEDFEGNGDIIMSEQRIRKNKIGARWLSDLEVESILPTYRRIYHQIEQFRLEKEPINHLEKQKSKDQYEEDQNNKSQDKAQKTNNIGIIGKRGAGKTSVLKTIRVQLEKDKRDRALNDIILPIIVPENMSESGTLMATILGMLSEVIEKKDKEELKRQKRSNIDCIRKSPLQIKCDEVIKQYTYIQKEYRDILIRQYTTENHYVNQSAMVFNSDTEFINKFNELIEELINVGGQDSSLLFLFIDDIDLSTYRCADVVKTLLSYLSNENIVTFISGDLETFEEALTLDFLRQENILDNGILERKVGDNTLFESKKLLAYEYLKKIIPPIFRYNIKYWSLAEKGSYRIENLDVNQIQGEFLKQERLDKKKGKGMTLSDLLFESLKGWVDPAFFRYAEIKDDKSQEENKDQVEYLPYTYHLFDDTSRGLNNIYNVLSEIAVVREGEQTSWKKEKQLLLDTIISSKPIYNKHRNEIQLNFFHVGEKKTDSRVFFDNAGAIIYKSYMKESLSDTRNSLKKSEEIYYIEDPVERFALFILVDFAARLLYEEDYERKTKADGFYKILKEMAIKDLFFYPIIAEKVMDVSKLIWENKDEKELREKRADYRTDFHTSKMLEVKRLNSSFLLKGDLVLNLAYYKNLPLDKMLKLYGEQLPNESEAGIAVAVELEESAVIAIWKAFSSEAKLNGADDTSNIIARHYSDFWKEFAYIRDQLSSSVTQNIAIKMFDDEVNAVLSGDNKNTKETWEELRKKMRMGRILSNTMAQVLKESGQDAVQKEWQEIHLDNLYVVDNNKEEKRIEEEDAERRNIENRIQILKIIDSDKLWQAEAAGDAVNYLRKAVQEYAAYVKKNLEEKKVWRLNTSDAADSWDEFENTYVGGAGTIARRTRNEVDRILGFNQTNFKKGMPLHIYYRVVESLKELAGNDRVWYGQSEAQKILNDMQKAYAEPGTQDESWDLWLKKHSYFKFLLQCLYKYKIEAEQGNDTMRSAYLLAYIIKALTLAHKDADRHTLENFIAKLNKNLKNKIDSEDFEKLFS